jgi:hypothetical protein
VSLGLAIVTTAILALAGRSLLLGFALAAQALLVLSGGAIFLTAVAWRTGLHAWSFRPRPAAHPAG